MKQKVFIFNGTSRAAMYGIGTYIDQLIFCLKNTEIEFDVVHLHSEGTEVLVTQKDGYRQISIPSVNSTLPKSAYYYSRNVSYILKEFIPLNNNIQYIFHLNFMSNSSLVSCLKKMFKCKIVTTIHYTNWNFTLQGNQIKLKSILEKKKNKLDKLEKIVRSDVNEDRKMLGRSDRFICVANHTLHTLKKICKIDVENGVVINNALKDSYQKISPKQKLLIKEKYHIPSQTQVVVFAGRVDEAKGVSFLLDAFKKVVNKDFNIHLFIAGDGNFNRWLSESNGFWTRISFTGRLSKAQLYELYSIADLGVVCSLHEEFGYVASEMMMHEIPLIVSDTGGLSEIIENNISGVKIPVKIVNGNRVVSANKLAKQMQILLSDSDFSKMLAVNARKRFLEKYELNIFSQNMINLYLNL